MKRLHILIGDNDKNYCSSLSLYIRKTWPDMFDISIVFSENTAKEFFYGSDRAVDLFIGNMEIYRAFGDSAKVCVKNAVIISENCTNFGSELKCIEKYIPADELIKKAFLNFDMLHRETKSKIIMFYSPLHESQSGFLASNSAAYISLKGKKVFYLSLDGINPATRFFKPDGENKKDFCELLYSVTSNKEISFFLKNYICNDIKYDIGFFDDRSFSIELENAKKSEVENILHLINSQKVFDTIVITPGSPVSSRNLSLFEVCDFIVIPINCSIQELEDNTEKLSIFLLSLKRFFPLNLSEVLNKIIFTANKCKDQTIKKFDESPDFGRFTDILNGEEIGKLSYKLFIPEIIPAGKTRDKFITGTNSQLNNYYKMFEDIVYAI